MIHRRSALCAAVVVSLVAGAAARPAVAQNGIDGEATTPALPGFPDYTVRAFRTDGFAARALAAEADDPPWSRPMEARIRSMIADDPAAGLSRLEVLCRTTRCGILAVHAPTADRAKQSEILSRFQSEGTDVLGFDGSMAASFGQNGASRYTAIYFEGFRNMGPPLPLPVWLLAFGLSHDRREQLLVGEEIVQAGSTLGLRFMTLWLRASDVGTRANAAYVFARYGDRRGIDTLTDIVTESGGPDFLDDGSQRALTVEELDYVAYLLSLLGDPAAFEPLWRVLDGPLLNGYSSRPVERALIRSVDSSAIPFLIRELDNRNPFLRAMAIQVLAEIGAVEALPELERLIDDKERAFRGSQTTVGLLARQAALIVRAAARSAGPDGKLPTAADGL